MRVSDFAWEMIFHTLRPCFMAGRDKHLRHWAYNIRRVLREKKLPRQSMIKMADGF